MSLLQHGDRAPARAPWCRTPWNPLSRTPTTRSMSRVKKGKGKGRARAAARAPTHTSFVEATNTHAHEPVAHGGRGTTTGYSRTRRPRRLQASRQGGWVSPASLHNAGPQCANEENYPSPVRNRRAPTCKSPKLRRGEGGLRAGMSLCIDTIARSSCCPAALFYRGGGVVRLPVHELSIP